MTDKSMDQDYEAIKKDISQLRNDIAALLATAKVAGKENLSKAHDEASQKLKDNTEKVGGRVEKQYEERPLIFMIGAFLIGIFLGRVLSNK